MLGARTSRGSRPQVVLDVPADPGPAPTAPLTSPTPCQACDFPHASFSGPTLQLPEILQIKDPRGTARPTDNWLPPKPLIPLVDLGLPGPEKGRMTPFHDPVASKALSTPGRVTRFTMDVQWVFSPGILMLSHHTACFIQAELTLGTGVPPRQPKWPHSAFSPQWPEGIT